MLGLFSFTNRNPNLDKRVFKYSSALTTTMNRCIRAVEHKTSQEEYKAFRRGVGHVVYEVFKRIVEPICKQHPSLRPPEMEA